MGRGIGRTEGKGECRLWSGGGGIGSGRLDSRRGRILDRGDWLMESVVACSKPVTDKQLG
jgi:hypothetical protein